jgi:Uma2 family endonuclease
MAELKLGAHTVDVPYTLRLYGVTDAMFDELVDEDTRAELLDGVMTVHSPASTRHDDVAGFVRTLLRCYARRKRLGRVFGPDSVVHLATCRKFAPDAYFLAQERVPSPLPRKQFEGAPDLIVEVLSPSNRGDDLDDKRPAYREAGVRELWFIDPDTEEVLIDRKRKRGYATTQVGEGRLHSTVLPGFWLDLAWLRADEPPDDLECLNELLS